MKPCWCKFVMAVLIIVLAWWQPGWEKWGITILGVVIAGMSMMPGGCCCAGKCETKK